MDKHAAAKSMTKILKLIPKAAQAAVLFSPGRDKRAAHNKLKTHMNKGISGPMIPFEARGVKSKNFEAQEPTSPKISCMGQIKHKKRICEKQISLPKGFKPEKTYSRPPRIAGDNPKRLPVPDQLKEKPPGLKKMFGSARKSDDASMERTKPPLPDRAPNLGQMRKFASSRDTLANFDWKAAQIAPVEDMSPDFDEYSSDEDDVIIPFSSPLLTAGLGNGAGLVSEPRKEINLWKRRTTAQPEPLQLDMVRGTVRTGIKK